MSAHVLLNLLIKFRKEIKCEACRAFYLFFATSLINLINRSTNVRFYLSYDIKIILKSYFWRKKRLGFAICLTLKASFHNIPENL